MPDTNPVLHFDFRPGAAFAPGRAFNALRRPRCRSAITTCQPLAAIICNRRRRLLSRCSDHNLSLDLEPAVPALNPGF